MHADLGIVVFILFIFFIAHLHGKGILKLPLLDKYISNNSDTDTYTTQQPNYFVYKDDDLNLSFTDIESILANRHPYYQSLHASLKPQFVTRLQGFLQDKSFFIYAPTPYKEMPVLIAAAATQISFGLQDYFFEYYKNIVVHKETYLSTETYRPIEGHVQGNCITLAWKNLLIDNEYYTDGDNVALHEMAHALYIEAMLQESADGEKFEFHFTQFATYSNGILQQQHDANQLYSNYAFSNLQEFWAVSVELFFEKSQQLQILYPQVYSYLQQLLNQNPLNIEFPVGVV